MTWMDGRREIQVRYSCIKVAQGGKGEYTGKWNDRVRIRVKQVMDVIVI